MNRRPTRPPRPGAPAGPMGEPLQQVGRTEVRWRGRRLAYFAGCDYFRLASHPAVQAAARSGLARFGLNAAASRRTTGNHAVYEALEQDLARWFGEESAVLLSNGYLTNLAAVQALDGDFTHVLADERAHVSLRDAARWSGRPVRWFPHRNAARAAEAARRLGPEARVLVMTDGLFAHSGEVAPLAALLRALPRTARILVDDCHGAGTLGATGGGTLEHLGVRSPRVIRTLTLSKAFGAYGGAVLGTRRFCETLRARSAVLAGNTPLPFPLAQAARVALRVLGRHPALRRRLQSNTDRVRAALRAAGLDLPDAPGPILPLHPASAAEAVRLRRRLLAAGIHPPFIRYPGNESGYFRIVIASEHTPRQLDALAAALGPDRS
ncbi:MAG: 8-amino-7-oxononanoate synthase [Verrucomicrobiota bacterium]